jgi:hypothetical protein
MEDQVVVMSCYQETAQLVRKLGEELKLNILILDSGFEDTVEKVKEILARKPNGISVIIIRGATLKLLRENIPHLPWVSIDSNEYDLVLALDKARSIGERIAIFAPAERIDSFEAVTRLMKFAKTAPRY